MHIRVAFDVELTTEDVVDLMASAVYGVTYWVRTCSKIDQEIADSTDNIEEYIAAGGDLLIVVDEPWETADGKDVWNYHLTRDKLIDGLEMWIANGRDCYGALDPAKHTIDFGCIDAECADEIVQYALFKEVVYG